MDNLDYLMLVLFNFLQTKFTVINLHVFSAIVASSEKHSKSNALRRLQLGFRPLHFAAVGLPLRDTATNGAGSSKTGAFKINDGGVVGMSWYLD